MNKKFIQKINRELKREADGGFPEHTEVHINGLTHKFFSSGYMFGSYFDREPVDFNIEKFSQEDLRIIYSEIGRKCIWVKETKAKRR